MGFSEVITPLRGVTYLSLLVGAHHECFRILLLIYTSGFCLIVDAWNAWTLHYDERKVDCDMAQFDMLGFENWMFLPSLLELLMSCKIEVGQSTIWRPDTPALTCFCTVWSWGLGKRTLMFDSGFGVDMYVNGHWFQDIMVLSNASVIL